MSGEATTGPRVQRVEDAEAAAALAARLIADAAAAAIAERGRFSLGASGGSAPWRMFELLAGHELEWAAVEVFQVDERVAPPGDDERNLTHLERSLERAGRPSIRPMPVDRDNLDVAARLYDDTLPDPLDLVHLGIGDDGHTASLVPGNSVLEVTDRRVAMTAGEYEGRRRMTLTYPALAAARRIVWLVTGAEKREPLAKLRAGDPSIPAGRVEARDAVIVCDAAAAGSR